MSTIIRNEVNEGRVVSSSIGHVFLMIPGCLSNARNGFTFRLDSNLMAWEVIKPL